MKWLLCTVAAFGLACQAGADGGGGSWAHAKVARESREGWSREVGGLRLQLARAVRNADGSLQFQIVGHATPAGIRRLDKEMISLHLSDARGVVISSAGPVPFGGGWAGGKVTHGWGWHGAPATVVYAHVEWQGRGMATKKMRIRPAAK